MLSIIKKVGVIERIVEKDDFVVKYKEMFEGLGTFKEKCITNIDDKCKSVAKPPRRIPFKVKPKFKEKLTDLQEKGFIRKVENPNGWVSKLVIVEKPDKFIRIFLDPQDLNAVIKRNQNVLLPTLEEISEKLCNKSVFTVQNLKDGF